MISSPFLSLLYQSRNKYKIAKKQ